MAGVQPQTLVDCMIEWTRLCEEAQAWCNSAALGSVSYEDRTTRRTEVIARQYPGSSDIELHAVFRGSHRCHELHFRINQSTNTEEEYSAPERSGRVGNHTAAQPPGQTQISTQPQAPASAPARARDVLPTQSGPQPQLSQHPQNSVRSRPPSITQITPGTQTPAIAFARPGLQDVVDPCVTDQPQTSSRSERTILDPNAWQPTHGEALPTTTASGVAQVPSGAQVSSAPTTAVGAQTSVPPQAPVPLQAPAQSQPSTQSSNVGVAQARPPMPVTIPTSSTQHSQAQSQTSVPPRATAEPQVPGAWPAVAPAAQGFVGVQAPSVITATARSQLPASSHSTVRPQAATTTQPAISTQPSAQTQASRGPVGSTSVRLDTSARTSAQSRAPDPVGRPATTVRQVAPIRNLVPSQIAPQARAPVVIPEISKVRVPRYRAPDYEIKELLGEIATQNLDLGPEVRMYRHNRRLLLWHPGDHRLMATVDFRYRIAELCAEIGIASTVSYAAPPFLKERAWEFTSLSHMDRFLRNILDSRHLIRHIRIVGHWGCRHADGRNNFLNLFRSTNLQSFEINHLAIKEHHNAVEQKANADSGKMCFEDFFNMAKYFLRRWREVDQRRAGSRSVLDLLSFENFSSGIQGTYPAMDLTQKFKDRIAPDPTNRGLIR